MMPFRKRGDGRSLELIRLWGRGIQSGRRRRTAAFALALAVMGVGSARLSAEQASLVFRPLSGSWRFETAPGGEVVNCLGIPSTIAAVKGEATLTAAPDGRSLRLQLGSQLLELNRQGLVPVFHTVPRAVSDGVSVRFELVVETPIALAFKTIWTNAEGCKGTYPFRLTLLNASEPAAVVPRAGPWALTHSTVPCGLWGTIVLQPGFTGVGSLALGPVSSLILTSAWQTPIVVERSSPTSWRATGVTVAALVAGMPATGVGDLILTFTEPTQAHATLALSLVMATGGCSALIILNLTSAVP